MSKMKSCLSKKGKSIKKKMMGADPKRTKGAKSIATTPHFKFGKKKGPG